MSAELLRKAADSLRDEHSREDVASVEESTVWITVADLLDEFAEAYDWCAERWVDADEAAADKVWGYESAVDLARLIVGESND